MLFPQPDNYVHVDSSPERGFGKLHTNIQGTYLDHIIFISTTLALSIKKILHQYVISSYNEGWVDMHTETE